MKTFKLGDREVQGDIVGFQTMTESYAEYHLDDGTVLRGKTVLLRVVKSNEKNQDGSILYLYTTQFVAVTDEA